MVFEVHDRDRRALQGGPQDDSIFGRSTDDQGGFVGGTGFNDPDSVGRGLNNSVVADHRRPWDPYGVAVADLAPLCHGARILRISVPVLPCEPREAFEITARGAAAGRAMHPGHYLGAGTTLELTVELAYSRDFRVDLDEERLLVISGAMDAVSARKRVKKTQTTLRDVQMVPSSGALRSRTPHSSLVSFQGLDTSDPATSPIPDSKAREPIRATGRPFSRFVALLDPCHAGWLTSLRTQVQQVNLRALQLDT